MSSEIAIKVDGIKKCYHIYNTPRDRLKQLIIPRFKRLVGVQYRNFFREFWAIKDVSFDIKKGDAVGIIGRNGCGKSTLLQMICGTLSPTGGSITTHGRIAALLELGSGFNPDFTGRENVYMNAALLGLSRKEINSRYDEIVQFADIGDFINQPVKSYSSGMTMRLAFAVSVCVDPDILIVDEALSVGDAAFQFKCLHRLQQLVNTGTTLLFVSHDVGMVKSFCNHAIYLHQGFIKACGTPGEVVELYLLDLRDDQRRCSGITDGVVRKPFGGNGKGIAFGTEEGSILSAVFTNTQSSFSNYKQGEEVSVLVTARVQKSVQSPSLSLIVLDRRMMDIGGNFFLLESADSTDGWMCVSVIFNFPVVFSGGNYNITIRLENRENSRKFQPIDKQVAMLNFEVIEEERTFLGSTDLHIKARQIDNAEMD